MPETLALWVPGLQKASSDDDNHRRIRGLASTEDEDQQGETILQKGIDFSPLVQHGHINWNHRPGPENVIGEPTFVGFRDTRNGYGLFMEGILYKGTKNADAVWELINAVEAARNQGLSRRQLGWSVEGGIVARDEQRPKIIRKSIVRHMAVTHEPVNAKTYLELAKSLGPAWAGVEEFDLSPVVHHTFETVADLAKSFGVGLLKTMAANVSPETGDMATMMHSGRRGKKIARVSDVAHKAADLLCELGDECPQCNKVQKGRARVLTHLVKCAGYDVDDSYAIVKALALTLN